MSDKHALWMGIAVVLLLATYIYAGCSAHADQPAGDGPPLDGDEALASIEVMEGFRVELFAAEPLVQDPVAMEVDEHGRIYVVEMPSYPLDASGLGRVKLLEDTTGDGFPDAYTVFADDLKFPKGVMRWKEGILVADAPHLYYLEDTTGDGKADRREIMLTGFALSNPQHNFNTPIYGLDNWIYLANGGTVWTDRYEDLFGDRGSEVRFEGVDEAPVLPQNAGGRNVRFRLDTHEIEMRATWTQFGHTFDDWGRHFLISNAHHHFHEAIARKYVERNPYLPTRSAIHYTPEHGDAAEVYPITLSPEHQLLTDRGVFTSASGITYYQGGAFPAKFDNVTFVAESVHNLVHADVVEDDGAVFKTRRLSEEQEFLASTDAWFRPVQFYIGPDGALYVIDYYRRIIEHPQWMDDETLETADLYESTTRGRIYRVVPEEMGAPEWTGAVDLAGQSARELAAHLESPNIWWRRTAQRLLMDRPDEAPIETLREMVRTSASSQGRLHALWTLDGYGALDAGLIRHALQDDEAGVRENAIRLAESQLDAHPDLTDALLELADDPDPKVRYQLVLTLGELQTGEADAVRERILFKDIEDPWMQIAVLSAPHEQGGALLEQALARLGHEETSGRALFFSRIAAITGNRADVAEVRRLIQESLSGITEESAWWRRALLDGLTQTLPATDVDPGQLASERNDLLETFFATEVPGVRRAALEMLEVLGMPEGAGEEALPRAVAIAEDRDADAAFRTDALRMIALVDVSAHEDLLRELVDPNEPSSVQQAAVRGLGSLPGAHIGPFLLERWATMTPSVRDEAVNALMQEEERVELLLDAVEEGSVLVSTIGWHRRVVLMRDWSGQIRDRARGLLSEDPMERAEVIEQYRDALAIRGDAERGREVYIQQCAECHQVRGEDGVAFGPDLGTVRHWSPQALLTKILDPNRSITDGFEMWVVERTTGGSLAGVIISETAASVTLRNAAGEEITIPRSEIASISASNVSAMPSGLEQQIDEQEMADLIAFIRGL